MALKGHPGCYLENSLEVPGRVGQLRDNDGLHQSDSNGRRKRGLDIRHISE